MILDSDSWSQSIFGSVHLYDKRLTKRLVSMGSMLSRYPGDSITRCSEGNYAMEEGAYRFIENIRVSPDSISEGGFDSVISSLPDDDDLLLIQDSTTLSYKHSARNELGVTSNNTTDKSRGWLVHASLLLSSSGNTLGLLDLDWTTRDDNDHGRKHKRSIRPYTSKESYKWESATRRCRERLSDHRDRTIIISDRESDVYENLQYMITNGQRFVIRTQSNRKLDDTTSCIFEHLSHSPVLGKTQVQVSAKGGRRSRLAEVSIRSSQVVLKAPRRHQSAMEMELEPIKLSAISIIEESPPEDVENPLNWILWTSEPAATLSDTLKIQRLYSLRWRIEEYFKAWKSGCNVEELRMPYADNLQRLAVILAFVAVRLLQLKELNNRTSELPCDTVLESMEWKILWLKSENSKPLPMKIPTIRWAYYALAKIGGWRDTRNTGKVGWKALWIGWARLMDMKEAVLITKQNL